MRLTPEQRFWNKVRKSEGCWEWFGAINNNGYGNFWANNKTILAHRFSWESFRGERNGLLVLHHCDNRKCVRPDHLFLGTSHDNHQDMLAKGRFRAKLNDKAVRHIRAAYRPGNRARLAAMYGTAPATISDVLHGRTWNHVGPAHDQWVTGDGR